MYCDHIHERNNIDMYEYLLFLSVLEKTVHRVSVFGYAETPPTFICMCVVLP